jgi:hypothetical protein
MDQMIEIFEAMTFSEKVSANERIAAIIREEGGGKTSKTSKKKSSKKSDEPKEKEKTKRKCAPGTLAWQAFVKHIKTTRPDAFEGIKLEKEKLAIASTIRHSDEATYNAWVAAWIVEYNAAEASSVSSASEAEAEAAPVASLVPVASLAPVASEKKKTAAEKVKELKEKAKKAASEASEVPAAPVKEKKEKEKKEKKSVKSVKKTEEPQMAQREIDGVMYWHEPETNALWEVTGENFADGAVWTGYFQPGNEEEPIRLTDGLGQ